MTSKNLKSHTKTFLFLSLITLAIQAKIEKTLRFTKINENPSKLKFLLNLTAKQSSSSSYSLPLTPDFTSSTTFFGVQTFYNSGKISDWGLETCKESEYCQGTIEKTIDFKYDSIEMKAFEGKIKLDILKDYFNINFIKSNKADTPFNQGVGVLALSPKSDFIKQLRLGNLQENENSNNIEFKVKVPDDKLNTADAFSPMQEKIFDGSEINFTNEKVDFKSKFPIIEGERAWGFGDMKITISFKNREKIEVLDNGSICIIPKLPFYFYFSDEGKYTQFKNALNQDICGKNEECGESEFSEKNLDIFFVFNNNRKNTCVAIMKAKNFMYTENRKLKAGFGLNKEIFQKGGECEGYDFAVGRMFFSKFRLKIHLNQQEGFYSLVDEEKISKSFWSLGVILIFVFLALVFLVCIALIIYSANVQRRKSKMPEYPKSGNVSLVTGKKEDD